MNEKRYFKIEYDEEWYLFDSTTISEQLVKEQAEYGYGVFANSLSPSEVEGLLNEQQDTISKQLDKIIELQDKYRILEFNHSRLEKRNKAQYEKIGEQQATINLLLDLLYQSEATVINEYSSHIGEDMDKLDKIFKEKDIKEIERFVRGCDDE